MFYYVIPRRIVKTTDILYCVLGCLSDCRLASFYIFIRNSERNYSRRYGTRVLRVYAGPGIKQCVGLRHWKN